MSEIASLADANVRSETYYVARARVRCRQCGSSTGANPVSVKVVLVRPVATAVNLRQTHGSAPPSTRFSSKSNGFPVASRTD